MPNQTPHLATRQNGPLFFLEKQCLQHQTKIEEWFISQWQLSRPPLYASIDCRNAGFKIAPIDTNIFPAGWNNLSPETHSLCASAAKKIISALHPTAKKILIIPENHTRNTAYFDNINALKNILSNANFQVHVGSIHPEIKETQHQTLSSGGSIQLHPISRQNNTISINGFTPDCIILNNDLSTGTPLLLKGIQQTVLPAMKFGWSRRLKSEHFTYYQALTEELSELIEIDPWLINPLFDQCPEVDFLARSGQDCIKQRSSQLLKRIQKKYDEHAIKQKPFIVIKADQGTYGMAVMVVRSIEELDALNRKQRTKMSSSKGGRKVTRAIIQEGVYSFETMQNNAVAEPVIYLFGQHVVGGFYRIHNNKGPDENLNSPGMNFTPLAFANKCNQTGDIEPINRFYTYGVIARLAMLAAARELHAFHGEIE